METRTRACGSCRRPGRNERPSASGAGRARLVMLLRSRRPLCRRDVRLYPCHGQILSDRQNAGPVKYRDDAIDGGVGGAAGKGCKASVVLNLSLSAFHPSRDMRLSTLAANERDGLRGPDAGGRLTGAPDAIVAAKKNKRTKRNEQQKPTEFRKPRPALGLDTGGYDAISRHARNVN